MNYRLAAAVQILALAATSAQAQALPGVCGLFDVKSIDGLSLAGAGFSEQRKTVPAKELDLDEDRLVASCVVQRADQDAPSVVLSQVSLLPAEVARFQARLSKQRHTGGESAVIVGKTFMCEAKVMLRANISVCAGHVASQLLTLTLIEPAAGDKPLPPVKAKVHFEQLLARRGNNGG